MYGLVNQSWVGQGGILVG